MSAPPLPDVFGNYALQNFVEVVSPADISWLPQTAGWWWLGAALLGAALHVCWKRLRHWYRNRYRGEAAGRLKQLTLAKNDHELVSEANKLLKLTAIAGYSREEVASLSGEEWVRFLNQQCPKPSFSREQGEILAVGAYRREAPDAATAEAFIHACLTWVREHQSPHDV